MTGERSLSATEQAHLATVRAHLAAVVAVAADPGRLPELAALLADDFTWCLPSANAERGVTRSREAYLGMLANPALVPEPAQFARLELRLVAATVQGDRVAAETESIGARRDGLEYHNYYHQVWRFDAAGRILEYRIYDDTEHVAATHVAGNLQVVQRFFAALSAGDTAAVAACLDDAFQYERVGQAAPLERAAWLAAIEACRARGDLPVFEFPPDGLTASGERLALEARVLRPATADHHFLLQMQRYRILRLRDHATGPALLTTVDRG
jgi:ketosteroid isomerase-like protein